MVVDRAALAIAPAQDERLVGRADVQQIADVAFRAEDEVRSEVVDGERHRAEPVENQRQRQEARGLVEPREERGEVWAAALHSGKMMRYTPKTDRWTEYVLPEPYSHDRRTWIDNSTNPVSVWYVDHNSYIVRVQARQ